MIQQIHIFEVIDGADFDKVLKKRAFTEEVIGRRWASQRRDELRQDRINQGEKDELFVEAIDFKHYPMDLEC